MVGGREGEAGGRLSSATPREYRRDVAFTAGVGVKVVTGRRVALGRDESVVGISIGLPVPLGVQRATVSTQSARRRRRRTCGRQLVFSLFT